MRESSSNSLENPIPHWQVAGYVSLSVAVLLVLHLFYAYYGEHHVDEGYYHLAPTLVRQGFLPYRDFLWVQTPLYPYVYGGFQALLGPGLLAGRFLTALFSLLAIGSVLLHAKRLGGSSALVLTCGLVCWNSFQVYHLTILKLYGLTTLLLTLGLTAGLIETNRRRWAVLGAGCLSLAVCVRLTVLPALVVFLLGPILSRRPKRELLAPIITSLVALGVVVGGSYVSAPEQFTFGVYEYHLLKESFSLARQLVYKVDNMIELARHWFLGLLLGSFLIVQWIMNAHVQGLLAKLRNWRMSSLEQTTLAVAAVIALHSTSQVSYMYTYLVVVFPIAGLLIGVSGARALAGLAGAQSRLLLHCYMIGSALALFSQGLGSAGPFRAGGPVRSLVEVARYVKARTPADKPILTENNSLAVEAERQVLPGDEMNVLSYAHDWPEARCRTFHVLNLEMLERAVLNRQFGALILSRHSFIGNFPVLFNPGEEGARPTMLRAIAKTYTLDRVIRGLGYLGADWEIYLPRTQTSELDEPKQEAAAIPVLELSGAGRGLELE